MKDNIRAIFEREIEGKYTYEETEDWILIYSVNYSFTPSYKINKHGIGGEERGMPYLIGDFGSLDNNVLAFAIEYGSGNSHKDDRMHRLYGEATSLLKTQSKEEIISDLRLADIVQDYLENNDDVITEQRDHDHVFIEYRKENYIGLIAVDSNNSWKYYLDIIKLVSAKQYVEKFLADCNLDVSPELFIKLVSFSARGIPTKVRQIQLTD